MRITSIPPPRPSLFPKLPSELQIQIWEAALPEEPRLVALWLKIWQTNSSTGYPEDSAEDRRKFLCKNPPPTLLHVCRQSREVALKKFSLQIKTPIQKCPIYIDPKEDTVYTYNFYASRDPRFTGIRHLAIPFTNNHEFGPKCSPGDKVELGDFVRLLRNLPRLTDVVFVNHNGRCLLHVEPQFVTMDFSHWTDSSLSAVDNMWDRRVAIEKAHHPEWNVPKFSVKDLRMPDGKLTC